jgi:hypothetical protein
MKIKLTNFRIFETGADGGRRYLATEIDYKGQRRKIIVFFADKSDEQKLATDTEIVVEGILVNEKGQSLNLLQSRIID